MAGFDALRSFKPPMSTPQIDEIVDEYDDAFAEMLAAYTKYQGGRGIVERKKYAGYAFGTFKRIRKAGADLKEALGGPFMDWFTKENKRAAQAAQLAAEAREAKRRAESSIDVPKPPAKAAPFALQAELTALPPDEYAALLRETIAGMNPTLPQAKWLKEHAKSPDKPLKGGAVHVVPQLLMATLAARKKE